MYIDIGTGWASRADVILLLVPIVKGTGKARPSKALVVHQKPRSHHHVTPFTHTPSNRQNVRLRASGENSRDDPAVPG